MPISPESESIRRPDNPERQQHCKQNIARKMPTKCEAQGTDHRGEDADCTQGHDP